MSEILKKFCEKYEKPLEVKLEELLIVLSDKDAWKSISKKNSIIISKRKFNKSKYFMFRTETLIKDTDPETVFEVLFSTRDEKVVIARDPNTLKYFKILHVSENEKVEIAQQVITFNAPLVSDREFMFAHYTKKDKDKGMIYTVDMSLDDEDSKLIKKQSKKNVLAQILNCGFMEKVEGGTKLIQSVWTAPNGWFPAWAYNAGCSASLGKMMKVMKKQVDDYVTKKKKEVNEKD